MVVAGERKRGREGWAVSDFEKIGVLMFGAFKLAFVNKFLRPLYGGSLFLERFLEPRGKGGRAGRI